MFLGRPESPRAAQLPQANNWECWEKGVSDRGQRPTFPRPGRESAGVHSLQVSPGTPVMPYGDV